MGLGPTAVIGYMDENGNWTPVTSERGLPVGGGGAGGGGGGAVESVNGQTGEVELTGSDIKAGVYIRWADMNVTLPIDELMQDIMDSVNSVTRHVTQVLYYYDGQWHDSSGYGYSENDWGTIDEIGPLLFVGGTIDDLPPAFDSRENIHLSQEFLDGGAVNTAIDDLQAEIDTLQSTVADLEARLEALENSEEG